MKLFLEEGQQVYKLDISVEYEIVDVIENDVDVDVVLDAVGEYIENKIAENMDFICKGNKFRSFTINYTGSQADNILTFEVVFDDLIIGKYFVNKVRSLLKQFSLDVEYKGEVFEVRVNKVLPMLRYIG